MSKSLRILKTRFRKRLLAALLIAVAGLIWGLMLWKLNLGLSLRVAAYDIPFLMGDHEPPEEIVMIHLDEASHDELNQPLAQAWDRRLHARLVSKLAEAGAKIIVFDILFHDEMPEQDQIFAEELGKHGNVILAAEFIEANKTEGAEIDSLLLANPTLRRAAAGWGLTYLPLDPDGVVRRIRHVIPTPFGDKPSLSEMVRTKYQGNTDESGKRTRLIYYYGGSGTFQSYSYSGVLADRGIPDGAFKDKIVLIGAKQQAGMSGAGKDMFPTPYTPVPVVDNSGGKSRQLSSGMEIQATAIGNLIEGRSLQQMDHKFELSMLMLASLVFATVSCLLTPVRGISLSILLALGFALAGILLQMTQGFHFLWTLPALGQMPLIVGLSLFAHYFIEYSGRWKLRSAFKSYMSAEQARQIDEGDVSLELGGKEVEVTILFSDLAGFTSMSEGLPPASLSKALISYFESATRGILDNQGTIIKYIGDAVLATWGAPLMVDREADRAIEAALQMQEASAKPISLDTAGGVIEQVLETRVGINFGPALAGNLGSSRRFDYTVIGDSVNTAARLEGLNKMLGTSILVSESVLQKCAEPERYLKRRMGSYVLKGRRSAVVVYEIYGHSDKPDAAVRKRSAEYLACYEKGLESFENREFEDAAAFLTKCAGIHDRLADDPAARLMLNRIAEGSGTTPEDWTGQIVLDSK